jgi:hypothetical protein
MPLRPVILVFVPGVILIVFGFTLQAGAAGAVKAIKMSPKLVAGKVQGATVTPI